MVIGRGPLQSPFANLSCDLALSTLACTGSKPLVSYWSEANRKARHRRSNKLCSRERKHMTKVKFRAK